LHRRRLYLDQRVCFRLACPMWIPLTNMQSITERPRRGLPSSSSHTLIGSVIGVGLANQLMSVKTATSGVDWSQATSVGKSLLLSPIVGFLVAGFLLMLMKALIRVPALYKAPEGTQPPPFLIRCLLILTCGGVSFAHGSNDGQKGMGLIMLILIGTVPTAYALNHAITGSQVQDFVAVSHQTMDVLNKYILDEDIGSTQSATRMTRWRAMFGHVNSRRAPSWHYAR